MQFTLKTMLLSSFLMGITSVLANNTNNEAAAYASARGMSTAIWDYVSRNVRISNGGRTASFNIVRKNKSTGVIAPPPVGSTSVEIDGRWERVNDNLYTAVYDDDESTGSNSCSRYRAPRPGSVQMFVADDRLAYSNVQGWDVEDNGILLSSASLVRYHAGTKAGAVSGHNIQHLELPTQEGDVFEGCVGTEDPNHKIHISMV